MTTETGNKRSFAGFALTLLPLAWLGLSAVLIFLSLDNDSIEITWQTETEYNTAGFNIYRSESENGRYKKLNNAIIPASGDASSGGTYTFVDKDAEPDITYYYQLEDIEYDGAAKTHPPVAASTPDPEWLLLSLALLSLFISVSLLVYNGRTRKVKSKNET